MKPKSMVKPLAQAKDKPLTEADWRALEIAMEAVWTRLNWLELKVKQLQRRLSK
jgi:hypothetical protein